MCVPLVGLQAREHFCQVIQLLKKKHQTADAQEEQDSITVFSGTFNMGKTHIRTGTMPDGAQSRQGTIALVCTGY